MVTLYLALCLWVVGLSPDMLHLPFLYELLQFATDVTGPVVRQEPWHLPLGQRHLFQCPSHCFLHVPCVHRGAEFPMDDITTVIVQNGREIVPSPSHDLQIGEVRLPHLVDPCGLVPVLL